MDTIVHTGLGDDKPATEGRKRGQARTGYFSVEDSTWSVLDAFQGRKLVPIVQAVPGLRRFNRSKVQRQTYRKIVPIVPMVQ